jgi:hypothetical protein
MTKRGSHGEDSLLDASLVQEILPATTKYSALNKTIDSPPKESKYMRLSHNFIEELK